MSQVFDLLKSGKPVPQATIEAIPGYLEQMNHLQAQLTEKGRPYEVRFLKDCYVLQKLTHEEAVEADIDTLQQHTTQPDIFVGTKYERLRKAADETRQALVAKGILRPRPDENL